MIQGDNQMKRKAHIRLLGILMSLVLLFTPAAAMAAGTEFHDLTSCPDWPVAPELASECAILVEAKTGAILYGKNADESCYPASITKLMTALLVLENCSLDDTVTFSYRATHELESGSTHIARTEGEELSVNDCLHALLLMSANEVAQALAEHVGGTIEDFAVMMTERAKELGCTNTNFTNPSGLNDENHQTTCHDMALILAECVKNPAFLEIESHLTYTIPSTNKNPEELPIAQKHKMMKNGEWHYDGVLAGKTGYTTIAKNTLATYAVRDDMELICIIMKSPTQHYPDTTALLDYGFNNFSMIHLASAETLEINDSSGNPVEIPEGVSIPDDEWLILPSSVDFASLTTELETVSGETDSEGNPVIGRIHYSYKGTDLGSASLASAGETTALTSSEEEEADAAPVGIATVDTSSGTPAARQSSLKTALSTLRENPVPLIIIAICIILLIVLIALLRRRRRRRRRNAYYFGSDSRHTPRRRKGNKYTMRK